MHLHNLYNAVLLKRSVDSIRVCAGLAYELYLLIRTFAVRSLLCVGTAIASLFSSLSTIRQPAPC